MDPRIAARRALVRAEQRRRRQRYVLSVVVVAALGAATVGAVFSPLLGVRRVQVTLLGFYPTQDVARAAGVAHGKPLIEVDGAAVARRVDSVPQLGDARVRLAWPSTIDISATVRQPVAVARSSTEGWALLDSTGRVVSNTPQAPAGLPVVVGVGQPPPPGGWLAGTGSNATPVGGLPQGSTAMSYSAAGTSALAGAAAALEVVDLLPAGMKAELLSVSVLAHGALSATIDVQGRQVPVALGDAAQLGSKVSALASVLNQVNLAGAKSVDLSVPERPAIDFGG
jgi:cell division septal protein FtsQ